MEDHCHLENIGKIWTVNWFSSSVESMEFAVELCRLTQLHSILWKVFINIVCESICVKLSSIKTVFVVNLWMFEGDTVLSSDVFLCLDSRQSTFALIFLDSYGLYCHILRNIYACNLKTKVRMAFFKIHSMQLYFQ